MHRIVLFVLVALTLVGPAAAADEIDWKKVDEVLGRTAAVSADVHRYGFARSDLQVTLDGVTIRPALALGGWVAFKPAHDGAMVMGDLVLLETEINPVMAKLLENGIEITAVHNHLLRGSPATFYMHVGGHGDAVKLASAIRTALAESKTPLAAPASRLLRLPSSSIPRSSIRSSAPRARPMAASISSACRVAIRSPKTECKSLRPAPWGWRLRSIFSPPAAARPPSPATSC
jgi:hypothetical protein